MTRVAEALLPKLRFSEFRDQPEWELLTLSSVSHVNPKNDGLPEQFVYIDLESVKNSILIEPKEISRDAAPSRAQRLLSRQDIIFQTVRPYQRNNLFFDINDGCAYVASTGYAQLRAHKVSPEFLYQLLHTDSFVSSVLARCTGSNYPAINPSALASIDVSLPRKTEQQKIANCLSSLDDLIAAEGRKLEALRQHKQGLMQQLFPQPGEASPRLRFPEFRDEWRKITLGNVVTEFRARSTVQDEYQVLTSARSGLMRQTDYYGEGRITDRSNVGFNIIPPDHLTYRSRSDDGRFFFNHNHLGVTGIISIYYPVFYSSKGSNAFLAHLLNRFSGEIGKHSVGTSQRVLSMSSLLRFALPIPDVVEQQRIAAYFSSLDEVLTAQARKMDVLRQHKQGLMQQLFPSLEGQ